MKRVLLLITIFVMAFAFTACGSQSEKESDTKEIALIATGDNIEDGSFNENIWDAMQSFCDDNDITYGNYLISNSEKENEEAVTKCVKKAIKNGGKLLIFSGSNFEKNVYELQSQYNDVDFVLIDGVPNDGDGEYKLAGNSLGILFSEEEAGYLAGYAAVIEGYKKIGFMGGEEVPSVKRFGYGFLQGIRAAAKEHSTGGIQVNYKYEGTFNESSEVQSDAAKWYKKGTEVIFACGGSMGKSVIQAAEKNSGLVIGVDSDQSGLSDTVITTAEKEISTAVEDVLKEYRRGNFIGNNVENYTAENDGVGLEMEHAKLKKFSSSDYKKLYKKIKNGQVEIKTDTEIDSPSELESDQVTISEK